MSKEGGEEDAIWKKRIRERPRKREGGDSEGDPKEKREGRESEGGEKPSRFKNGV